MYSLLRCVGVGVCGKHGVCACLCRLLVYTAQTSVVDRPDLLFMPPYCSASSCAALQVDDWELMSKCNAAIKASHAML